MFLKISLFNCFAMAAVQTKRVYTQCIYIFKDPLITEVDPGGGQFAPFQKIFA